MGFLHLRNTCGHHPPVLACNMQEPRNVKLTDDRNAVTCGECRKTQLFRFGKWRGCPTRPCCGRGIWAGEE